MLTIGLVGNDEKFAGMATRMRKAGFDVHIYDVYEDGMEVLRQFPLHINDDAVHIFWIALPTGEIRKALAVLNNILESGDLVVDASDASKDHIFGRSLTMATINVHYAHIITSSTLGRPTMTARGSCDGIAMLVSVLTAIADPGMVECTIGYGMFPPAEDPA